MIDVSIPEEWYGPGAKRMREIANRVSRIAWFVRVPAEGASIMAERLVADQLELLRALDRSGNLPMNPETSVVRGPWHTLHRGRWGAESYEHWSRRWADAVSASECRVLQALHAATESNEQARQLLREPLWPIPGCSNVLGGAFVADPERASLLNRLLAEDLDRETAWALLSTADTRVWDAMLWELAAGVGAVEGTNPFKPLLELYELGYFPMGWGGNSYDLYVPELNDNERKKFAELSLIRGDNYICWE